MIWRQISGEGSRCRSMEPSSRPRLVRKAQLVLLAQGDIGVDSGKPHRPPLGIALDDLALAVEDGAPAGAVRRLRVVLHEPRVAERAGAAGRRGDASDVRGEEGGGGVRRVHEAAPMPDSSCVLAIVRTVAARPLMVMMPTSGVSAV